MTTRGFREQTTYADARPAGRATGRWPRRAPQDRGHVERRRDQGRHRRTPREPRDRGHQVHRVLPHRVLLDARRGDPLGGRLRQPDPVADRGQALAARGDREAPVRLRPGALRLLLRRVDRAVHARWLLRAVRGVAQVPGDPWRRLLRPVRVAVVVGAAGRALRGDRDGGLQLPHRRARVEHTAREALLGCGSCAAPRRPSCP